MPLPHPSTTVAALLTGACSGIGTEPAAELRVVESAVAAVLDLTTRFLPDMLARGSGAVLNGASTGAFQPPPGQASYGIKALDRGRTVAIAGG